VTVKVARTRLPWDIDLTAAFGMTQEKVLRLLRAENIKPVKTVDAVASELFARRGVKSPYVVGMNTRV
jgi:hypothetical protein